jgi:hypothetical protein
MHNLGFGSVSDKILSLNCPIFDPAFLNVKFSLLFNALTDGHRALTLGIAL